LDDHKTGFKNELLTDDTYALHRVHAVTHFPIKERSFGEIE